MWLLCVGLVLLGLGNALSFVPIFPEALDTVKDDYEDSIDELNNVVSALMNAFYGSASLGEILSGAVAE